MSCGNCKKCYELADGTLVRIEDRNGNRFFETAGAGEIVDTEPALMIYTKEIPCEKFNDANQPPASVAVLEEVDADGKQTGKLVQVTQDPNGTLVYTDLSDGSTYTKPAGFELHTSEDTDYNLVTHILCDAGTTVFRTVIYKDGDITDVVSSTVTKIDGSAHTLSGAETAGDCNANKIVDIENGICFGDPGDPAVVPVMGYIRTTTNLNTMASVTEYFDSSDTVIAAGLEPVKCC